VVIFLVGLVSEQISTLGRRARGERGGGRRHLQRAGEPRGAGGGHSSPSRLPGDRRGRQLPRRHRTIATRLPRNRQDWCRSFIGPARAASAAR
jgi:hypothetical protein